jgi:short-subunit dehydrogenase
MAGERQVRRSTLANQRSRIHCDGRFVGDRAVDGDGPVRPRRERARSGDALQRLAQQLPGSLPVTADMTKFDRVREAVRTVHRHYGRIDGLVNNAGRSYAASIEEIEPEIFDEIFHLNVLGPIVAMQAVIPVMRAQAGGSIVNINSGTAFMTIPQYSVYSASKRALLGFSLTARAELEKDRIVVSEVYPFITATNFGKNRIGKPSGGERGRENFLDE